jgi:hypothetical protein
MTVLIQQEKRRCDARCYNGKATTKCKCICGGRNHAGGLNHGVDQNRRLFGMETNRAKYMIVEDDFTQTEPLVIKDVGRDAKSVTNDAENVVRDLVKQGHLPAGRRLLYYDSMGQLDELLIKDGKFAGFAPGPRRTA